MKRDFTIKIYEELLDKLISNNYNFQTFESFLSSPKNKSIILRHDVDLLPKNSLTFAKIQNNNGISGTYYFRATLNSWNEKIIKNIIDMGHEVGYHYENMDTCNGDIDHAWDEFRYNLDRLRSFYDVKTICMHGSPFSKYDNRLLWSKYNYHSLGIIGEPYFDIDYNDVFYLTDTGRRWDGWRVSVRDKVSEQSNWINAGLVFNSTDDIINNLNINKFPRKVMFTFHPQRWNSKIELWIKELLLQYFKNKIKKVIIAYK